ncbi:PREDICTED: zinc finger protein NUTCRACKER-like [Populus euphratica]|uniref:Zinc finger protein NUTCRACKER-like n=1 Tax=Populus euphratica TaxID=75702 RepID=A0AAJ6U890_POPEU|nr:PREDICTED: zinc finger protein NUTCRACKER-like [Populus euphratica]
MAAASSSATFFGRAREENENQMIQQRSSTTTSSTVPTTEPPKKRRNQPGTPNPDAEVIALSPKTLMATNRFICEVCNKGFQREQNLQLHRRGHNLPWKLKQKSTKEVRRKVYLCPEPTCVHHDPSRALGDLTGIKKHYSRKHGEKKWKCEKCSKRYAVQSDWKAHSKTCGTREYRCDCGTLFSRRDSFITHRAFCDALAQESARHPTSLNTIGTNLYGNNHMSLGLSQVGSQISQLQVHHPSGNNMLRLGNAGAAKFEHLIPPPNPSSIPMMHSSGFFMGDANQGPFPNKSLQGLLQLPDLQSNTNNSSASNLFNLGFFPNSSNASRVSSNENANTGSTSLVNSGFLNANLFNNVNGADQGTTLFSSNMGGDHVGSGTMSSLFNTSMQNISPYMSATALLQKAAQMGSTTSSNSPTSLLKGLGSSSTTGAKSVRPHVSTNFGSSFGNPTVGESLETQMESESQFQGLMNSLANGSSSIFGNEQDNSYTGFNSSNFSKVGEEKLHQSLAGSDKLTLDFLGVGGRVRNVGGGFAQGDQHSMQ